MEEKNWLYRLRVFSQLMVVAVLILGLAGFAGADSQRMMNQKRAPQTPLHMVDPNAVIAITGTLSTMTAQQLAQSLVGDGVQISNVTSNCDPSAAGTFTITGNAGIGLASGIILGTGAVANVIGPNTSPSTTTAFGTPGDADLNALSGMTTYDACVIEFDFIPTSSTVSFSYVFGSEEYNEYVNTSFNDAFGFFVNGQNCALINGSPVTINTINNGNPYGTGGPNSDYFINNDQGDYNTQLDGFTKVLTCAAAVTKGQKNHIKLAIADASDSAYDSDVFIGAKSFVSADYAVSISPSIQSKSGNNTTTATYTFEVKNLGGLTDSFNLTLGNTTWTTVFGDTGVKTTKVGPLAPLESAFVYVNVTIPKSTSTNTETATVTVSSIGAGSAKPVSATATITTTALGLNNCVFTRELPTYYIPGIPMTVAIHAVPTCIKDGENFWALEDNVPAGWTVTSISNSGTFSGGKVNWDNLPAEEITLTYVIQPATSANTTATFMGDGAVSGTVYPITGVSETDYNAGYHPADKNSNNAIDIAEYTLYGSYWKSGKEWPSGWNPISAGFVAKAGEIWAKNKGYHFSATAGKCPDCWVVGSAAAAVSFDAADNTALVRTIDKTYKPGVAMGVSLLVTPPATTAAYVVEETPPAGWAVSNIDNGGSFDGINKKIKWGIFKDAATVATRTLTYTVTPPATAKGQQVFSGLASFDGVDSTSTTTISDTSVEVTITFKPLAKPLAYKGAKGVITFTAATTVKLDDIKSAISKDSWISIDLTTVKFANGKGSVAYSVGSNDSDATREGKVTIGSASFAVSQAGTPCKISAATVAPTLVPVTGGDVTINVTIAPATCTWSAAVKTGGEWLSGLSNKTVTGSGSIKGTAAANKVGKPLSTVVTVATADGKSKKTITVKQSK